MAVTQEDLLPALSRAVENVVKAEVERAVTEAAESVRERVRERLGSIAASLLSDYDIRRQQRDLVITVRNQL